ncbi:MAG TPA: DUF5710 domain-containing protein [Steroidobacteraceae bacterium]|nr:DUF5710 domain-containing protein [Steroidobacteraceae bacterium]
MERTYLFVPPEEKSEVQTLGARWDADSKRWYIDASDESARFSRWLCAAPQDDESAGHDAELIIASTQGHVAAAVTSCQRCHAGIEVICIHCDSGIVSGEPLTRFTVSDIWAMDEALARQLRPWPHYRRVDGTDGAAGYFANHCPRCGSPQDDMYLHSEPDEPFFNIPRAAPGTIKLTALAGTIRLSGDEHFEVD